MKMEKGPDALPTKPTEPKRLSLRDPEVLWPEAIGRWEEGHTDNVERLLREGGEIPLFARDWLARLAAGEIKKRRGAKKHYPTISELAPTLMRDFEVREHFAWQMIWAKLPSKLALVGTPKEQALAATAEKFGLSEDEVSHIVYPRKKRGA